MHENRETSETPEVAPCDRPVGKGNSRTTHVYVFEESDSGAVPMNHLNKDGKSLAESEEGRPLVKENTHQSSTHSTQSEARVSQGLAGVRKAAKERKGMKFTALFHHLTIGLLREGFFARVLSFTDLGCCQAHRGAQFFKMFANFMHGDTSLFCRVPAQFEGRLDLFAKNPLQSVGQWFAQF